MAEFAVVVCAPNEALLISIVIEVVVLITLIALKVTHVVIHDRTVGYVGRDTRRLVAVIDGKSIVTSGTGGGVGQAVAAVRDLTLAFALVGRCVIHQVSCSTRQARSVRSAERTVRNIAYILHAVRLVSRCAQSISISAYQAPSNIVFLARSTGCGIAVLDAFA